MFSPSLWCFVVTVAIVTMDKTAQSARISLSTALGNPRVTGGEDPTRPTPAIKPRRKRFVLGYLFRNKVVKKQCKVAVAKDSLTVVICQ